MAILDKALEWAPWLGRMILRTKPVRTLEEAGADASTLSKAERAAETVAERGATITAAEADENAAALLRASRQPAREAEQLAAKDAANARRAPERGGKSAEQPVQQQQAGPIEDRIKALKADGHTPDEIKMIIEREHPIANAAAATGRSRGGLGGLLGMIAGGSGIAGLVALAEFGFLPKLVANFKYFFSIVDATGQEAEAKSGKAVNTTLQGQQDEIERARREERQRKIQELQDKKAKKPDEHSELSTGDKVAMLEDKAGIDTSGYRGGLRLQSMVDGGREPAVGQGEKVVVKQPKTAIQPTMVG